MSSYRVGPLSVLIAYMLIMMPLPDWAEPMRPDWVTLVLIYWAMNAPQHIGVFAAWLAGLLLDVSHGAILGQHAAGLVMVVYIVHLQHQRLRVASLIQQSIVIFFLLLMKQVLVLWVNGMIGEAPGTWAYFLPSITGAIFWPWVYIVITDLRHRYGYRSLT